MQLQQKNQKGDDCASRGDWPAVTEKDPVRFLNLWHDNLQTKAKKGPWKCGKDVAKNSPSTRIVHFLFFYQNIPKDS